jgi:hypothetical protein
MSLSFAPSSPGTGRFALMSEKLRPSRRDYVGKYARHLAEPKLIRDLHVP